MRDAVTALLRRTAQEIRHAPGLRSLGPVWSVMRGTYVRCLTYLGKARGVPVTISGHVIRLHPKFAHVSWESVEVESYRAFAAAITPGDVIYDVGAHIGTYTIIALRRSGPGGAVVAYEPDDAAREHLVRHLEWNGAGRSALIRAVCCGAVPGEATFYYAPGEADGQSGLVPVRGFSRRSVPVTTLDEEIAAIGLAPSLVKIDVEGAEWEVLKGAEFTLRRDRPRLLISLHPAALVASGATPDAVLEWLHARDYRFQIVARDHETHVLAEAGRVR